ncbi:MAG: mevalonate kinase [Myxococcota bacterium]
MKASCPGKTVLLGEYAVLEQGRAMVAAVSARATGVRRGGLDLGSPVVREVRNHALKVGATYRGGVAIHTDAFRDARAGKLGIGSSAATAICTAALILGRGDDATFDVALAGHRAAAGGRGSGIDLRACFHGGVVVCSRQPGPVEAVPSHIPGLKLSVFHLGLSAKTAELIGTCKAAADWNRWVERLRDVSEAGIVAWRRGDADEFLKGVRAFVRAMEGLGESAGIDLITEPGRQLRDAAEALGGAAKPSGAGGGDVAVAWTRPEDAHALAERVSARRLDLDVDPTGLRIERPTEA